MDVGEVCERGGGSTWFDDCHNGALDSGETLDLPLDSQLLAGFEPLDPVPAMADRNEANRTHQHRCAGQSYRLGPVI